MKNKFLAFACLALMILVACNKDDDNPAQPATESSTIVKVNFDRNAPFTFFSFKNNAVVANSDSASTKWAFALRLTTILVNSNASGPGSAGVILQDAIFDNITEAPATGYAYDTASNKLAIKDGTWFDYNGATRSFVPKAGKVFIFKTADNRFAKMEILEATYDNFVGIFPEKINYRIRFVYQGDGSRNLKKQ